MIIIACERAAENGYDNQKELTAIKAKLEGILFYED